MHSSRFIVTAVASAAFAFASSAAHAAVLITINDSNPSAVTFTATGNAGVTDASHTFAQGLGFANFFAAAPPTLGLFPAITATSTSLTTGVDGTPNYTGAQSASFSGSATGDLSLFAASGNTENFSTATPAFTGTATFNFAASTFFATNILPAAGTTGNLFSGAGGLFQANPVLLGTYQVVVPEPTSLAAIGLVGTTLLRRRRA